MLTDLNDTHVIRIKKKQEKMQKQIKIKRDKTPHILTL